MNKLENLFPTYPSYKGIWQPIFLEPIIGSGEKITIVILAISKNLEYKIIQAIRTELLDCLYGNNAFRLQSMIDWVIESINKELMVSKNLSRWNPPLLGIDIGKEVEAADENIDGILKQGIRFSASLSALAIDAERDDLGIDAKKTNEKWIDNVCEEVKVINPSLTRYFKQKIKINNSKILTTYGFLNERNVINFGVINLTRISQGVNYIKAKILDLENFKKTSLIIKPDNYEIIISSSIDDHFHSEKSLNNLNDHIEMVQEIASIENIGVFIAKNAKEAAEHLVKKVA